MTKPHVMSPPSLAPRRGLPATTLTTVPNVITLARTLGAVGLGLWAVARGDLLLLGVAYAIYWVGDMADGWTARHLRQETRLGAVLDIVADRACTSLLCAGLVVHLPEAWLVATVFLLCFLVLDTMLSLAFLCWPLLSPNYFHRVDRPLWRLNWSPVAKAANTAGVVLAVALQRYDLALGVALAVLVVKVWSARRMWGLLASPGAATA